MTLGIQWHGTAIVKLKLCGLFNAHINRLGSYWDNHVFDLLDLTLLGDYLWSTSPRFFYVPLGIQWHRTAIVMIKVLVIHSREFNDSTDAQALCLATIKNVLKDDCHQAEALAQFQWICQRNGKVAVSLSKNPVWVYRPSTLGTWYFCEKTASWRNPLGDRFSSPNSPRAWTMSFQHPLWSCCSDPKDRGPQTNPSDAGYTHYHWHCQALLLFEMREKGGIGSGDLDGPQEYRPAIPPDNLGWTTGVSPWDSSWSPGLNHRSVSLRFLLIAARPDGELRWVCVLCLCVCCHSPGLKRLQERMWWRRELQWVVLPIAEARFKHHGRWVSTVKRPRLQRNVWDDSPSL